MLSVLSILPLAFMLPEKRNRFLLLRTKFQTSSVSFIALVTSARQSTSSEKTNILSLVLIEDFPSSEKRVGYSFTFSFWNILNISDCRDFLFKKCRKGKSNIN